MGLEWSSRNQYDWRAKRLSRLVYMRCCFSKHTNICFSPRMYVKAKAVRAPLQISTRLISFRKTFITSKTNIPPMQYLNNNKISFTSKKDSTIKFLHSN